MTTPLERRREQNLRAPRTDTRAVTPSTRSFAQAIDRQRESVERVPLLRAARPDAAAVARALDEAEVAALAFALDDAQDELTRFSEAAHAVSVPVLRTDLLLEEFQVYESRAAGADAVLFVAALLPGEPLARLCSAARGTHMSSCVLCADAAEIARAAKARADVFALALDDGGAVDPALLAALPRRALLLGVPRAGAEAAGPLATGALRGRLDAVLDPALARTPDPAAAFRRALAEES